MRFRKLLRITYIIPATFAITLLVWGYRYMWFSAETVPEGRVAVAIVGLLVTGMILFNEIDIDKKPKEPGGY